MLSELNPASPNAETTTGTLAAREQSMRRMDSLWTLRWNQEIQKCLDALPEVMGYSRDPHAHPLLALSARLWLGSLHRVRNHPAAFQESLAQIQLDFEPALLGSSRYFHFEKAVDAYLRQEFIRALEYFVLFRQDARTPAEECVARINEALCLDILGFPIDACLARLDELMCGLHGEDSRTESPAILPAPFQGIKSQRIYLELTQRLKNGDLGWIERELRRPGGFTQNQYFALWACQHPYLAVPDEVRETARLVWDGFMSSDRHLFQRGYRFGTLSGAVESSFNGLSRIMDTAERLYLWSWQFAKNPTSVTASRWIRVWNELTIQLDSRGVAAALASPWDCALLRNSLKLMSLLCPSLEPRIRKLLDHVLAVTGSHSSPWFDREYERLALLQHQLTLLSESSTKVPVYPEIVVRLASTTDATPAAKGARPGKEILLRIDLERFLIEPRKGSAIRSESLARAFHLLLSASHLTCERFVQDVFGFRKYDEFIHQPRIHQLLARMRALLALAPGQKIASIREGDLLVETHWKPGVWLRKGSVYSETMVHHPAWFELQSPRHLQSSPTDQESAQASVEALVVARLGLQFTRAELERELKESRATLVRRLNRWIKSGKVIRKGKGKSVVYSFVHRGDHHET